MKNYSISTNLLLLFLSSYLSVSQIQGQTTCNNTDPGYNSGDTGCVSFMYQGQVVTYSTVRANDGNIWLQQNLGSSQTANSMTDADSYGDLFQWGRWDDGHQLRNSATVNVPTPNNPLSLLNSSAYIIGATSSTGWWADSGGADSWTASDLSQVTAFNGIDPCRTIGVGWRMPAESEWVNVMTAENVTNASSGVDTNLKISAGGNRSSTNGNSFVMVGSRAYFWTSNSLNAKARMVYLLSGGAGITPAPRGQAASVRCLKDASSLLVSESFPELLEVYPNPTKDYLFIKAKSEIKNVKIYNFLSQKVDAPFTQDRVDLSHLPKGIFIAEITFKNNIKVLRKIVKN